MELFKLIIAGSRTIRDYNAVIEAVRAFVRHYSIDIDKTPFEIVSGGALGVDTLGEQFAHEYAVKLTVMPAEWSKHGRYAGFKRNTQMAAYADGCVILWDGKSKGAHHMYNTAKDHKLKVLLINYP